MSCNLRFRAKFWVDAQYTVAMSQLDQLTHVVAAVIQCSGRYLVAQRPNDKHHGDLWEFPGGKIKEFETESSAISRELKEELELTVTSVGSKLAELDDGAVALSFIEVSVTGIACLNEHQAIRWEAPDHLRKIDLCPLDRRFVEDVLDV